MQTSNFFLSLYKKITRNPRYTLTIYCALLSFATANAQSPIDIRRSGFDEIAVYNRQPHTIEVKIGKQKTILIARHSMQRIKFLLNTQNVRNTVFTVSYTSDCLRSDSLYCKSQEEQEKTAAEKWRDVKLLIDGMLQGTAAGDVIDIIRLLAGGLMGDDSEEFIAEVMMAKQGKDPLEQRILRMAAINSRYENKIRKIEYNKERCMEEARKLAETPGKSYETTAAAYFAMQEKSRFEIGLSAAAGFRAGQFKTGTLKGSSFTSYTNQPAFQLRAAYSYNAYDKYKRRIIDRKNYIVLATTQTRTLYQTQKDSLFNGNNGFSWQTVSIGYGIAAEKQGALGGNIPVSVIMDAGIISSVMYEHTITGNKASGKTMRSRFKGIVPYINIGYKFGITKWLDLQATYYGTFLYASFNRSKSRPDLPQFRQWNIGLSFNFARHYTYQY